jgi:hypothetical protein
MLLTKLSSHGQALHQPQDRQQDGRSNADLAVAGQERLLSLLHHCY